MKRDDVAISYYREIPEGIESFENVGGEQAYWDLAPKLRAGNEDRYKARARYLLKTHLIRMPYRKLLVEYDISDGLANFKVSQDDGANYLLYMAAKLPWRTGAKIECLVDLFATSEARMISGL